MGSKIKLTRIAVQMNISGRLELIAGFSNGLYHAVVLRDAADPQEVGRVLRVLAELAQHTLTLLNLRDIASGPHGYGWCPICGAPGCTRERRPNGDDFCTSGHRYLSANALKAPPTAHATTAEPSMGPSVGRTDPETKSP